MPFIVTIDIHRTDLLVGPFNTMDEAKTYADANGGEEATRIAMLLAP
jgi:hypothetical protein